ncbi:MAG: endonuclease NucS [Asgard group archaeon]|nr:endonuclease NucS [Asgard group archaeon]
MHKIVNAPFELSDLVKTLTKANCKKMITIFGNCSAIFDGRIKSYLPHGDRLLFIKKDETLILHGATGLKPLNWQKSGAGRIRYEKKKVN